MKKNNDTSLRVMEAFYTIQGEGCFQGRAAYFIRLGGCDVGCVWCDVKESWKAEKHPLITIENIVRPLHNLNANIVIVTGGEPLIYNLDVLTSAIKATGKRTHVETSGAHPLSGIWDWICLSPKKFKAPLATYFEIAHELKIIIYNKSDFEWAETYAEKMNPNCKLFLQPEWSKEKAMIPLIVDYVKEHPQWQISLQTHKYLEVP